MTDDGDDDGPRLRDLTLAALWRHADHAALGGPEAERAARIGFYCGAAIMLQCLSRLARLDDLAKRDAAFAALLDHWRGEAEMVLGRSFGPEGIGPKAGHG